MMKSHVIYTNINAGVLATVVVQSDRSIELSSSTVFISDCTEKDGKLIPEKKPVEKALEVLTEKMFPRFEKMLNDIEKRNLEEEKLMQEQWKAIEKEEKEEKKGKENNQKSSSAKK